MTTRNKILAVDDHASNLVVLAEILAADYDIRCVDSGLAALGVAQEWIPDLVLLDLKMPEIDGIETCRRMRRLPALEHAHIVMVSAKNGVTDKLAGYEAGADDFVVKPFDEFEILAKVRGLCRKSRHADVVALSAEVEATRDFATEALANLARLRDTETGEHLYRIRAISQLIAHTLKSMGEWEDQITPAFLADLWRASPLHDVGKVAVPDAILRKPGKLTPDERRVMCRHAVQGSELIEQSMNASQHCDFLRMAAVVARSHHERFDGKGYPDGLAGESIPLAARIVALADVYDALRSERVYKAAYPPEEAVLTIMEESGKHFDPRVVAAFLECVDECETLMQMTGDNHETTTTMSGCDLVAEPEEEAAPAHEAVAPQNESLAGV